MHKITRFLDIRVAVFLLILTGGSLATPSRASGDRPAAAVLARDITLPVMRTDAVETVAAEASTASSAFDATSWDDRALGSVDQDVFALALESAARAVAEGDADPETLTVIDFSVPSTERRMFVYDLRSRDLLFEEHVSHGRNSGHNAPTLFSNEPGSYKSSLGLYRAAEGYFGKHGYSLRLDGLEKGFNDRARERAIVIHGADYVNGDIARAQGRLGRSLGCPAVRPEIATKLIDAVKDGGLVFAYYPDPAWLNTSTYLN
jgi:L,D-transpeptidase catalytic domain